VGGILGSSIGVANSRHQGSVGYRVLSQRELAEELEMNDQLLGHGGPGGLSSSSGKKEFDNHEHNLEQGIEEHDALNKPDSKSHSMEESLDFEDVESLMWRKHQMRRFFQDRGHWWTAARKTTAWKWSLVVLTGVVIAVTGVLVEWFTEAMTDWKFDTCNNLIQNSDWGGAFFGFIFISIFLGSIAGYCVWLEPLAGGSGIPEIKAFLNGVNLHKVVQIRVLLAKVVGMCFSCASGLPLGKEGPMIHAGAIIGGVISQGNRYLNFGFDNSWNKFQDLRNDQTKR
jgi:hypothetical protein